MQIVVHCPISTHRTSLYRSHHTLQPYLQLMFCQGHMKSYTRTQFCIHMDNLCYYMGSGIVWNIQHLQSDHFQNKYKHDQLSTLNIKHIK